MSAMKMSWDEDREAAQNWAEIAVYFADVLAASAEELLSLRSTSQRERARQRAILALVATSLSQHRLVAAPRVISIDAVLKRCERAAQERP